MTMFNSIFGGKPPPWVLDYEHFSGQIYIIGDVHGCLALLKGLEKKIEADAKGQGAESLLVYIGDLVDRGPESYGVLAHLMSAPPEGFKRVCLMGNHEEMMLGFLDAPSRRAAWLDYGGFETLLSYGALENEIMLARANPRKMKSLIKRIVPQEHVDFLGGLAHAIRLKDFLISHAGGNPAKSIERQTVQDYLWGAGALPKAPTDIQKDVIHGHFIVENATNFAGIISIDTGAYRSGVLTAAKLGPNKTVEFISFSRQ